MPYEKLKNFGKTTLVQAGGGFKQSFGWILISKHVQFNFDVEALIVLIASKLPPLQVSLGSRFHVVQVPWSRWISSKTWSEMSSLDIFHHNKPYSTGFISGWLDLMPRYSIFNRSRIFPISGSDGIVRCYELLWTPFCENKTHLPNLLSGHMWVILRKIYMDILSCLLFQARACCLKWICSGSTAMIPFESWYHMMHWYVFVQVKYHLPINIHVCQYRRYYLQVGYTYPYHVLVLLWIFLVSQALFFAPWLIGCHTRCVNLELGIQQFKGEVPSQLQVRWDISVAKPP